MGKTCVVLFLLRRTFSVRPSLFHNLLLKVLSEGNLPPTLTPTKGAAAMGMRFWTGFMVCCGQCGHRNRPHPSPRIGIRLALLDQLPSCRGCGKNLHATEPTDRPLVRKVRQELIQEGLLPAPVLAEPVILPFNRPTHVEKQLGYNIPG